MDMIKEKNKPVANRRYPTERKTEDIKKTNRSSGSCGTIIPKGQICVPSESQKERRGECGTEKRFEENMAEFLKNF